MLFGYLYFLLIVGYWLRRLPGISSRKLIIAFR